MFGNILCTPFDLGELAPPGGAVPDLEVVVDARDDDVAPELRVLEQRGRKTDPALLVELRLGRAGEEEPLHPPAALAERVQRAEALLDDTLPVLARVREEAAVHAPGHDDPLGEPVPELRRQREPVLVVDRVLVLAEKHRGAGPFSTTLPHSKPLFPTCPPRKGESRAARAGPRARAPRGRRVPRPPRRRPGRGASRARSCRPCRGGSRRAGGAAAAGPARGAGSAPCRAAPTP